MSIAALYDIHGNQPALDAVLAVMAEEGIEQIVVGGDVVPGPMSRETLTELFGLPARARFIRGNGEREVLALRHGREPEGLPSSAVDALRWSAEELTEHEAEAIRSWPLTLESEVEGVGRVLFCHATPTSDTAIFTRLTPEASVISLLQDVEADLVVCGHTHMQFDRQIGSLRVVNAGSVGMPFGEAGAYWLKLGPGVELRRTEYDLDAAADLIRKTRYPQADEFATHSILQPPSEADVLGMFEGLARHENA
jgi:putative phosphoesterase